MKEWLKDNLISSLSLGAIVLAAVYYGKVQDLMFPDSTTKVRTIDHVNGAKTERELFETLDILDTVADFAKKDSKENLKRDSIRDDQVRRNTITIYQMKQTQDTMFKELKHALEHVDN